MSETFLTNIFLLHFRAAQMTSMNSPSNINVSVNSNHRPGVEEREKRRRKRRSSGDGHSSSSGHKSSGKRTPTSGDLKRQLTTNFGSALARASPNVPPNLLKKLGNKEVQGLGKVCIATNYF